MSFREFLKQLLSVYFIIVTLILIAVALFGMVAAPEQPLYPQDLLMPPVVAALTLLPTFVMYSKKELTVKQTLFRRGLQCALIEGIVLLLVSPECAPQIDPLVFRVIVGGCVLAAYGLSLLLMWLSAYRESLSLTEDLHKLQAKEE